MLSLPSAAEPLFLKLSVAFTRPTFQRIVPLCVGAILAMGQRTVTALRSPQPGCVARQKTAKVELRRKQKNNP